VNVLSHCHRNEMVKSKMNVNMEMKKKTKAWKRMIVVIPPSGDGSN
jgi:hypothetical protein